LTLEVRGKRGAMKSEFVFPFEKLDVWQMAVELAQVVLNWLDSLPSNRHIRLVSQLESAVTSPAQNIAEGRGRQYKKEFVQFLYIAEGSVFEVVTLTEIFQRNGMFTQEQAADIRLRCESMDRKLIGLIKSLKVRGDKE
jgi:four helix bundle protein